MSRTRLLSALIAIPVLAALGYWAYQTYLAPTAATPEPASLAADTTPESPGIVSAEGKVIPLRDATLAFRVAGRVSAVPVTEGDEVQAGEVLIRLEDAELKAADAQAQAAVDLAQAQLALLQAGPRPEEVAAAEAQVKAANSAVGEAVAHRDDVKRGATEDQIKAAEAQVAQAEAQRQQLQEVYNRIEAAKVQGAPREQAWLQWQAAEHAKQAALAALDQLRAGASAELLQGLNSAIGVAANQRSAAQAQLDLLQAGPRKEEIAAAEARLAEARAAQEAVQAQLDQATLRAPFAGTVVRLEVEVGEVVTPGAPLLVLADLTGWRVRTTDLAETDVVLVKPGQAASITLDAFKDETFTGAVAEIADEAETNRGNTTYAVTVRLDPTDAALRWGMTAFADIDVRP